MTVARRPRLRTILLLGMLLPILGGSVLAGVMVKQRWDQRAASVHLQEATARLGPTIDLATALGEEQARSTVIALAREYGIDRTELSPLDDLEPVRARVDGLPLPAGDVAMTRAMADLRDLRQRLDAGTADYRDVDATFARVDAAVETRWRLEMTDVEAFADDRPLQAGLRARLRTLRSSLDVWAQGSPRIRGALGVLLGSGTSEELHHLLEANARAAAALEAVDPAPGTRAAAAWEDFGQDPAVRRTERLLATAEQVGLGEVESPLQGDVTRFATALDDGAQWSLIINAAVQSAALDLEAAAGQAVADAGQSMRLWVAGILALGLATALVAIVTARHLTQPALDLEAAARRVEGGEFGIDPVPVRGPRELTATVTAFNDMAATLSAVEEHAVALAEDPDSAVLGEPLPGRTGQALQAALDRLRASVQLAEAHRLELTVLATHDALTGVLNRGAALEAIERDLARSRRDGTVLVALYLDLDGLKELNDTYGHAVGDEAIRRAAAALSDTTREGDVLGRLGGDEFVVAGVAPVGGPEAVEALAERLRAAVGAQTVTVADDTWLPLRASVGIALSDPGTRAADQLVQRADQALYRAKGAGRDAVAW